MNIFLAHVIGVSVVPVFDSSHRLVVNPLSKSNRNVMPMVQASVFCVRSNDEKNPQTAGE